MTQAPQTFADNVVAYALAGWPCIIPVPPTDKFPPPNGYTGAEGRDTPAEVLAAWTSSHLPECPPSCQAHGRAAYSVALRMPEFHDQDGHGWTVVGIDVDAYEKAGKQKQGANTLVVKVAEWGQLPPTWISTARTDGVSGIRFYRAPLRRYATKLTARQEDGSATSDVEIIQRHHRYAVVWPSPHNDAQAHYRWYGPDGQVAAGPPRPHELPELPSSWVEGLAAGATEAGPAAADADSGHRLLDQLLDDWRPECAEVTNARLYAVTEIDKADAGSRHDAMTSRVHNLVQLAAHGHPGAAHAVLVLRDLWAKVTAGEDRGEELERMLLTSARKAVTAVGQHQIPNDPCLMFAGGGALPAPSPLPAGAPVDEDGNEVDLHILEPPRWSGPRSVIGVHAFDPVASLDQPLAEKVLERVYPALRFAYDSNGWLLRCPHHWELHGRLSPWAVATVATLMPLGDITADKDSEAYSRAQRRARLLSTAGARAVAGKMDDLVAGGMHPASIALADLDSEPEVLWSGGVPWSLRASLTELVPADLDPAYPHMHNAGVVPDDRPTPLWDAFLEAVWPDQEIRRWAMRVLSIAATGYADRAMPILLGETGRGKTQVVHLLMSVLGSYAHAANPKLLSARSNEHDTIVFDLKGRRLSFIDEAPNESRAGQERLKQLTGGGELTGRRMNQDAITFSPSHTFVMTANPESEPVLTDPAVRSRTRLIPCDGDPEAVRVTRAAIGAVSGPTWRAEAPGVLAKLMHEAAGWLADPVSAHVTAAPEVIRYLAENMGAEQDPVSVWVAEETEPDDLGTPSRELYQAFTASCLRNNMRRDAIPTETKWGRQLTRLGYPTQHTEHGKRRPLRLRAGGHLPTSGPVQAPTAAEFLGSKPKISTADPNRLTGPDGLLTGSEANPSGTKPQVNPSESVTPDGSDGLKQILTHAQARARAGSGTYESPPTRQPVRGAEGAETAPDLRERSSQTTPDGLFDPPQAAPAPRRTREKTAEATQKAAAKREAKRLAAIAEAAGPTIPLPAVVTRDGAVRTAELELIDQLLTTITDRDQALMVDVEHTGYPIGHELYALRTVQLGSEHFAAVLDPHDLEQADVVRRHLAAAKVLHAHSATADVIPAAVAGLADEEELWAKMIDTAILAKLADPSSTDNSADLKGLSKAVLRESALSPQAEADRKALFKAGRWLTETEVTTAFERSGWAQVEPDCQTMLRYAASDVLDGAAIATRLPQPPPQVLDRERTAQRMTARMASIGFRFDRDRVEHLTEEHQVARADAADLVRAFEIDNPGSNDQVGAALTRIGAVLPRTATGKTSVAQAVLEPMRVFDGPAGDLARAVLEYRHHDTALKLLLEPWREMVRRGDGRARSTIYTLGADTGRMSSHRFNFQQVSREGGLRGCITADPGWLLASADFAGVELRVAAALSGDMNLVRIMADPDRDLHWEIARLAFGSEATKAQRYAIKRGVFGRIYGGGVGAVAAGVGVSRPVAQQVIDAMDSLTPQLSEWSRMVREGIEAGRTQFPTAAGRVIHLPKASPHAGPNYCIQGTARELLVDALLRWRETRWGECVLLPVHDEIVVMVPEAEAADATAALTECMTTELFGVPIIAEASEPSFSWRDSA